ncbi:hypothetical protein NGB36_26270 [Streptomyces sp. RB6PN25]|uniref:Transposase n=1 Tax=Streptomyces humicola TaxID=2953240 RepID=A0ABT1Q254_9ACTN|nr:hypothetical protein [Streptomyces humicola]MCQ4083997.1 hypothetical protein [Streptomyces humicola]
MLLIGPPEAAVAEIEDRRYVALVDLLDDLAGCENDGERVFIVAELATRAAQLALIITGAWLGGGKWLAQAWRARARPDAAPEHSNAPGALRTFGPSRQPG